MIRKEPMIKKMIDFLDGNVRDINHFLGVHAYAALIGKLEGLDDETQDTVEIAAIVHDIACPLCRVKYGDVLGSHQEKESEPLLREFFAEYDLPEQMLARIIYLVSHHHTYAHVEGIDYQILLEADYFVNAAETDVFRRNAAAFRRNVFRTKAGTALLDSIFKPVV